MSDLTEAEIYARMIDAFRTAGGCARQMAHSRKSERWLKIANLSESIIDAATKLAVKRQIHN